MKIADVWFETQSFSDGVTLIRERHIAPWLRCNIWHVRGRDADLIVDTGMGLRPLKSEIAALVERPVTAIMTHAHFDHAGGLHEFDVRCGHRCEAEIIQKPTVANTVADTGYVRAEAFQALPHEGFDYREYTVRAAPLTRVLDDGDVIDLGDRHFKVFHLPGHSPGSIALYEETTGLLFSGDVVYDGDLLDNLFHSDPTIYLESVRRLRELPVTTVHAGHFRSFERAQMLNIIDEFLAGRRRATDLDAWLAGPNGQQGRSDDA